jgi:hypothetical protein
VLFAAAVGNVESGSRRRTMQTVEGFDYFPLEFDNDGTLQSAGEFAALLQRAGQATDVIYLAHGFRNDANDAGRLYTRFLQTLRGNLARPEFADVASRRFVVAGLFWPSKPFREAYDDAADTATRGLHNPHDTQAHLAERLQRIKNEDAPPRRRANIDKAIALLPSLDTDPKAQDAFVKHVLSIVHDEPEDDGEGVAVVKRRRGSDVLARLQHVSGPQTTTRGLGDLGGSIAGAVGHFLNLTMWYVMKERSGTVGSTGVATAVREVAAAHPHIRTHLVGHSLGGRLMAACAKALAQEPMFRPDSLLLLEAAFSHYGFSKDNGRGTRGFFRDVVERDVVKGPFLSTFSTEDTVVGRAYSIMSRLAKDSSREIGDAHDEFGGLGRNGPVNMTELLTERMHAPGTPYNFQTRLINNLDGSGGFVKDHGDVTNDAITYAFASALLRT